jgi:hypothetical protein
MSRVLIGRCHGADQHLGVLQNLARVGDSVKLLTLDGCTYDLDEISGQNLYFSLCYIEEAKDMYQLRRTRRRM